MRFGKPVRRLTVITLVLACVAVEPTVAWTAPEGHPPCDFAKQFKVRWIPVSTRDRLLLGPGHAMLTCASSEIVVRAARSFTVGIAWETDGSTVIGRLGGEHLVRVEGSGIVDVLVVAVSGGAYYSYDEPGVRQLPMEARRTGPVDDSVDSDDRRFEELSAIGWRRLVETDQLEGWDMIWTQANGKVELELVGPTTEVGAENNVLDESGRPTGSVRFRPNEYWILLPDSMTVARVTKVIGDVWVATDRTKVAQFFERQRTVHARSQFPSPAAKRLWFAQMRAALEVLRREDPDRAEAVWRETLRAVREADQEWRAMLRRPNLE